MSYISTARWPYPQVMLGNDSKTSSDIHETKKQALAAIERLKKEGLGGEGKIFPI